MAEALGVGASVVSFIGLAGQILQGCHYISNLFDDIKDAPETLSYLGAEIKAFRIVLHGFQQALQSVGQSINIDAASEQVLTALKTSSATIQDLKALLDKHSSSGKRDWWKILKVAVLRSTFVKYCDRLEKSKVDILLAQSSIVLIINVSHRVEIQSLLHSMSSLNSNFLGNTTIITSTSDVSEQSDDASSNMNNAISTLTNRMVERMDAMPLFLGASIKDSLEIALRDFLRELRYSQNDTRNLISSPWHPLHSAAEQNISYGTSLDVVRQTKCERKLSLGYATITISSVTASRKVRDLSSEDNSATPPKVTSRRTKVDMSLPPWLTQLGLMISREPRPSSSILGCSRIRLQFYTPVGMMSPIVQDCFTGEVNSVYYHFVTQRASPHDLVMTCDGFCGESLLDIAWKSWMMRIRKINRMDAAKTITRDLWELMKEYEMVVFLVFSGLDPGVPRSGMFGSIPRIWELINEAISSRPDLTSHLVDMARLIISSASTNPFESETALFHDMVTAAFAALPDFHSCVYHQEIWPLPENGRHGKGKDPMDERLLEELFTIAFSTGVFSHNSYSFDRDPDACYLRFLLSLFKGLVANAFFLRLCIESEKISQKFPDKCYDYAVQRRVVACLESGMELTVDITCHFESVGKLEILREALLQVRQDPRIIDDLVEINARAVLAAMYRKRSDATKRSKRAILPTDLGRLYRFCKSSLIEAGTKVFSAHEEIGGVTGTVLAGIQKLSSKRVSTAKSTVRRKLWRSMIEPHSNFSIPLNVRNCLNRGERPGMFLAINDSMQSLLERPGPTDIEQELEELFSTGFEQQVNTSFVSRRVSRRSTSLEECE